MKTFVMICLIIFCVSCFGLLTHFVWTATVGLQEDLFAQGYAGFAFIMSLAIAPALIWKVI
jgi:hypothetical protein